MKAYVYQSTGLEDRACRTIHRNVALKQAVDPQAQISTDLGAALFEISESVKKKGLRPRHVVLGQLNTETGFRTGGVRKVAISTVERWEAIDPDDTFTIEGKTYKLIRKVAEEIGV